MQYILGFLNFCPILLTLTNVHKENPTVPQSWEVALGSPPCSEEGRAGSSFFTPGRGAMSMFVSNRIIKV